MYWRRSLVVTVILLILGFGLNALLSGVFFTLIYTTSSISSYDFAGISSLYNLVTSGLLHFFVLWAAFRYYSSARAEKLRRKQPLSAEEIIEMSSEEEVAALRKLLLPPSERAGLQ